MICLIYVRRVGIWVRDMFLEVQMSFLIFDTFFNFLSLNPHLSRYFPWEMHSRTCRKFCFFRYNRITVVQVWDLNTQTHESVNIIFSASKLKQFREKKLLISVGCASHFCDIAWRVHLHNKLHWPTCPPVFHNKKNANVTTLGTVTPASVEMGLNLDNNS